MRQFLAALLLAACATSGVRVVDLHDLAAAPQHFQGQLVRTCGQATHYSHNNNLRVDASDCDGPGIGVLWRASTAEMREPQHQCVTGVVEYQGCAGANICHHSRYDWYLNTQLSDGA